MTRGTTTTETEPPDLLTVEEAAVVLRVGRTTAYEFASGFLAGDHADGIPVVRIGRQKRVPRCKLEGLLGSPITWPLPTVGESTAPRATAAHDPRAARRIGTRSGDQSRPFTA
jgi:excisionase family DNA binding protein